MSARKSVEHQPVSHEIQQMRTQLLDRRTFLLRMAGGSLAALFPLRTTFAEAEANTDTWATIGAVQSHLFPPEEQAPGASDINALAYVKWVVSDEGVDADTRAFIQYGAAWVEEKSRYMENTSFFELDEAARERVLRAVESEGPGQNWLATLLLYVFEALLTDPVYGGNPDGIGWTWLGHTPGLPRPVPGKRYGELG